MSQNETNLDGQSPDLAKTKQAALLAAIAQLSPELLRDGQVDFEALKAQLGADNWAGKNHYELSWAGKAEARMEVSKTTSHTLMPDVEADADADYLLASADHVFIEGENLDVLRVLQKSYWGKVKMIYIDPPYNTGNDSFIYPDKYSETLAEYQTRTGERNADGYINKRSIWKQNSKESGQYHSAWLSMMYPRLTLARNLLREDGVIFISIDDNEAANLKLLCDEIFGAENFVGQFSVENNPKGRKNSKFISVSSEYCLAYAKNFSVSDGFKENIPKLNLLQDSFGRKYTPGKRVLVGESSNPIIEKENARKNYSVYVCKRESTIHFKTENISENYAVEYPENQFTRYRSIKNGELIENTYTASELEKLFHQKALIFKSDSIYEKDFNEFIRIKSLLVNNKNVGLDFKTETATADLFGLAFSNPKNKCFIKMLLTLQRKNEGVFLDFFAGSGTTAHAVMQLNAEDGGTRRSISVQIPEACDEKSEAHKAGYKTIADITRARITKAAAKIKAEHPTTAANLDLACFKLAPSNFKVWQAPDLTVESLTEQLALFQATEKTPVNKQANKQAWQHALLTELLLKKGLGVLGVDVQASPLAVGDATLYRVLMPDAQALYLCFDPYSVALKMAIVADQPAQVVLLNSCFIGDQADEQLSNLSLELNTWDCRLEVI